MTRPEKQNHREGLKCVHRLFWDELEAAQVEEGFQGVLSVR